MSALVSQNAFPERRSVRYGKGSSSTYTILEAQVSKNLSRPFGLKTQNPCLNAFLHSKEKEIEASMSSSDDKRYVQRFESLHSRSRSRIEREDHALDTRLKMPTWCQVRQSMFAADADKDAQKRREENTSRKDPSSRTPQVK